MKNRLERVSIIPSQFQCQKDGVGELQNKLQELVQEKEMSEAQFSQKRATFMKMFKQKEEEVNAAAEKHQDLQNENDELKAKVHTLQSEIDDVKTAVAISETNKQDEADEMHRKYQEEVASLQHIMKDALAEAAERANSKYEQERAKWIKTQETLELELQEMRNKLSQERESFLTSVAKTVAKKVGGVSTSLQSSEAENLEESMKRAQEDAEMLRSVVLPLEEEINMLKSKLMDTKDWVEQNDPKSCADLMDLDREPSEDIQSVSGVASDDIDEKVKELSHNLKTEKASRTDLEMYVAVLNTQKTVLQEDADRLRSQLHDVCRLLEQEKREHTDLKRTWQMANDQFLDAQRLMMKDLRRMESVLTTEQQRQIAEQKMKDAKRESEVKRLKELEQPHIKKNHSDDIENTDDKSGSDTDETDAGQDPVEDSTVSCLFANQIALFDDQLLPRDGSLRHSQSSQSLNTLKHELVDSSIHETRSLQEEGSIIRTTPERILAIPSLTEAQQKAITDPTPEIEASRSLFASVKAKTDAVSFIGKRLVSEKEWKMLQQEVKAAREKLGRPCDMCQNYETQLQTVQENEKKAQCRIRMFEQQLEMERQGTSSQKDYIGSLEIMMKKHGEEGKTMIGELTSKMAESEKYVESIKQQFVQTQADLQKHLKMLTENREKFQKELKHLQDENDSLVGKHSKQSQQMQEESINFPDTVDELHLVLLRYREEIITAKVAKEHTEETLRSENLFLRDQVVAEQQEKSNVEEALSQEISKLQEQLLVLQSTKAECDRQTSQRVEMEGKLKEAEQSRKNIQAKSKQIIHALQNQLEEQTNARTKLEEELSLIKAKTQSLQTDLDNSEAVQMDFVKLSQSLQIQLEKIRSAENEVRWQHEEDVEDCNSCKQPFSVTKRKHHCRHCGQIFCADCLTRTVQSGPNRRPSKVCDVCHTILVQDATPYFSTEPPHTPD